MWWLPVLIGATSVSASCSSPLKPPFVDLSAEDAADFLSQFELANQVFMHQPAAGWAMMEDCFADEVSFNLIMDDSMPMDLQGWFEYSSAWSDLSVDGSYQLNHLDEDLHVLDNNTISVSYGREDILNLPNEEGQVTKVHLNSTNVYHITFNNAGKVTQVEYMSDPYEGLTSEQGDIVDESCGGQQHQESAARV